MLQLGLGLGLLRVAFILLALCKIPYITSKCPCEDAPVEDDHYAGQRNLRLSIDTLVLCMQNATTEVRASIENLNITGIAVLFLAPGTDIKGACNVLLKVTPSNQEEAFANDRRQLCPGRCLPVPEILIPQKWLQPGFIFEINDNFLITCTLTTSMLPIISTEASSDIGATADRSKGGVSLEVFLTAVFWRRIMECYEKKLWLPRYSALPSLPFRDPTSLETYKVNEKRSTSSKIADDRIVKRPILTVVIWIGSTNQLSVIEEQAKVLSGQPIAGRQGVLGWAATEETYPCKINSTKCTRVKNPFLPFSAVNYMSSGWACAQRRPLRSLAHILMLVDPSFVIVLDDDTYLNYKLLMAKYGNYLTQGVMTTRPLVVGELGGTLGDRGHLTKWGGFLGGAGYIIGKKAIEILMSYELKYFKGDGLNKKIKDIKDMDSFRSKVQIHALSVYREGVEYNSKFCQSNQKNSSAGLYKDTCFLSKSPISSTVLVSGKTNSLVIPIGVRLIDFCANLMANENTCLHR